MTGTLQRKVTTRSGCPRCRRPRSASVRSCRPSSGAAASRPVESPPTRPPSIAACTRTRRQRWWTDRRSGKPLEPACWPRIVTREPKPKPRCQTVQRRSAWIESTVPSRPRCNPTRPWPSSVTPGWANPFMPSLEVR
uniref:(northern house mosquito) hypothetical protein n=1 Tax=Culex pipiens TaxID=7175 RepID=A0A8D8E2T5_CULPI